VTMGIHVWIAKTLALLKTRRFPIVAGEGDDGRNERASSRVAGGSIGGRRSETAASALFTRGRQGGQWTLSGSAT